jgi:hypothetical protein
MYLKISIEEFEDLCTRVAKELADPVMYNWKLWMIDKTNNIGVSEYYLNTMDQVNEIIDYLNTMSFLYTSFLEKSETELYEVLEEPTKLNFGPIDLPILSQTSVNLE